MKHSMQSITFLVFALCVLDAGTAQAASPVQSTVVPLAKTVVFGIGIDAGFTPYVVAVKKGFMDAAGVKGQYRVFDSGPAGLEALIGGQADVAAVGEFPPLVPKLKGAKFSLVARVYHSGKIECIAAGAGSKDAADLAGKKVALLKNSGGEYLWDLYAAKHSLTGKVTPVSLQPPEQITAMARGDAQAAATWEPWCSKVSQIVPGGHVLARSGDDGVYELNIGLVFAPTLTGLNAEAGRRTLRALIAATDWINAHPDEAASLIAPEFRLTPQEAKQQLQQVLPFRVEFTTDWVSHMISAAEWAGQHGREISDASALVRSMLDSSLISDVAPDRMTYTK